MSFKLSTPYIIIPVTYNTYIAYIKANLIDLSDLVLLQTYDMINVQILNNAGFVWNKEEMRILRERYRILGSAIGFTPKTFDINLPFILMPVEVQTLKEKKIIKLCKVDSSTPPSQEKISRFVPK